MSEHGMSIETITGKMATVACRRKCKKQNEVIILEGRDKGGLNEKWIAIAMKMRLI